MEAYLSDAHCIAECERAARGCSPQAESWRAIEAFIRDGRGHRRPFVDGGAADPPQQQPAPESAGGPGESDDWFDRPGPPRIAVYRDTTLVQTGVNPAVIRTRMGHSSARMTDFDTDVDALGRGGHTEVVARLLAVMDSSKAEAVPSVDLAPGLLTDRQRGVITRARRIRAMA
jgi:hypothetical protein